MTDGPTRELVEFAARLGLRPDWIQYPGTMREHFDLTETKRQLALRLGARPIVYGHEGYALMQAREAGTRFDLDGYRSTHPGDDAPAEQLDLF